LIDIIKNWILLYLTQKLLEWKKNYKYMGSEAQMHTLEGFAASVLMILVLIFVVQATSITPLTSSTANLHVETQLHLLGEDVLASLDYSYKNLSDLKYDLLLWDGREYVWNGSLYIRTDNASIWMQNSLSKALKNTFVEKGIAHNVEVIYLGSVFNTSSGKWEPNWGVSSRKWVWNGNPSYNAVTVTRKLAIHDTDVLPFPDFYDLTGIGDLDNETLFYNLVEIRLTLWRM
jgi:hypothetical protein